VLEAQLEGPRPCLLLQHRRAAQEAKEKRVVYFSTYTTTKSCIGMHQFVNSPIVSRRANPGVALAVLLVCWLLPLCAPRGPLTRARTIFHPPLEHADWVFYNCMFPVSGERVSERERRERAQPLHAWQPVYSPTAIYSFSIALDLYGGCVCASERWVGGWWRRPVRCESAWLGASA
jgi:hypothetical protein